MVAFSAKRLRFSDIRIGIDEDVVFPTCSKFVGIEISGGNFDRRESRTSLLA